MQAVGKSEKTHIERRRGENGRDVPVGMEAIDESCCGTAATLVSARVRERTTTLVLASMVSVISVSRKCSGSG